MSEESEETQVAIDRTSDELKKKQFAASSKETKPGYEGKSQTKLFPAEKMTGQSASSSRDPLTGRKARMRAHRRMTGQSDSSSRDHLTELDARMRAHRLIMGQSANSSRDPFTELDGRMRTHQWLDEKNEKARMQAHRQEYDKLKSYRMLYVQSTSIETTNITDMDDVKSSCERICGDESSRVLKYLEENPVLLETCQDPYLRDVIIYVLLKNPETKFTRLTEILVTMVTMYLESDVLTGQKFDLEVLAKYSNSSSRLPPPPSSGLDVFGTEWFDQSANFKFSILQQRPEGFKFKHQMFCEFFQALNAYVYQRLKYSSLFDDIKRNVVKKFIIGFHNPSIAQQLAKLCNQAPRDESEETQIIKTYFERKLADSSNVALEVLYELNDPIMTKEASASISTRITLEDPSLAAVQMTSSLIAQSNKTHNLEIHGTHLSQFDYIIGQIATCLHKVDRLELRNCGITSKGMERLSSAIQQRDTPLHLLDLSGNKLDESGFNSIATFLHKVDQLVLKNCGITSKGMERLSSSIQQRDTPMKRVNLHRNDRSRESGEHIAKCLHNIEDYQHVVWSGDYKQADGSNVVERTIQQLKQLDEYVFTNESSSSVGSGRARLEVGGCVVEIPPGALDRQVHIKLTSYYGKNKEESESITPMLKCEPHQLKFLKPVRITLPTCYVTEDDQSGAQVVIRTSMNRWGWKDFATIMYRNDLRISFDTRHFSFFKTMWKKLKSTSKIKSIDFTNERCFLTKGTLTVDSTLSFSDYIPDGKTHDTVKIRSNDDIVIELKPATSKSQVDLDYKLNHEKFNLKKHLPTEKLCFQVHKVSKLFPDEFCTGIHFWIKNAQSELKDNWVPIYIEPQRIPRLPFQPRSEGSSAQPDDVSSLATPKQIATVGSSAQPEDISSLTTPKQVPTTGSSVQPEDVSSLTTPKQVATSGSSAQLKDVSSLTTPKQVATSGNSTQLDDVLSPTTPKQDVASNPNIQALAMLPAQQNLPFQSNSAQSPTFNFSFVINPPSSSRQGALSYPSQEEPLSPERQKLEEVFKVVGRNLVQSDEHLLFYHVLGLSLQEIDKIPQGTTDMRAMHALDRWHQKNPSKSAQDLVELLKANQLMLIADYCEEALERFEDLAAREDSEEGGDANDLD